MYNYFLLITNFIFIENKFNVTGYNPQLQDTPTLQLNDLNKPGNYTFKLTVTDTDKATSSSTANVTVLKFTDYPPEANAGLFAFF